MRYVSVVLDSKTTMNFDFFIFEMLSCRSSIYSPDYCVLYKT